ncbi:MAG TPA: TolC family protein [Gammaproteobacteria bacterium]|nr:TolC family protein [Gammaproteobacteria bacterium]
MKIPSLTIALFLAATVSQTQAGQVNNDVLEIEMAVTQALENNPGLASMVARARALAAIPPQAGSLPDPRLSLNMMNIPLDTFDLKQEGMTQIQVGFSQILPFPGKLSLRESAAKYESAAAQWDVAEMRLKLVRDVKTVWWNLFFIDRAIDIVERNDKLLHQFVAVAQTKYKVGKGLQQDVLLAQLELSKLRDRSITLQGMRRSQMARLNTLLDYPSNKDIKLPSKVSESLKEINNEAALLVLAEKNRPILSARRNKIDAARARLKFAQKSYSPDFMLGANYGYRGGQNMDGTTRADFLSIKISMNLPLYAGSRQDKTVDQRSRQVVQTRYQLDDAQGMVSAQVSKALANYQQYRDKSQLFKQGIIPQAGQTVASMLAAYQVNKVDFLNLIRAQITLFNYETGYWKSFSQAKQALAGLATAIGRRDIDINESGNIQMNEIEVN